MWWILYDLVSGHPHRGHIIAALAERWRLIKRQAARPYGMKAMNDWKNYRVTLLLDGVEVATWLTEALSLPLLLVAGGLANRVRDPVVAPHDELRIRLVQPGEKS